MNYRNFASQPPAYIGGSLTANELRSQVNKNGDFFNKSNFLVCPNNRCDKRYSNSDGDGEYSSDSSGAGGIAGSGITFGQLFGAGTTFLTNQQQQNQIEAAQQLQQYQNQAAYLAAQEEAQRAKTIKAYAIPIAIGGGALILGIAAYFIFKKNA
jgi:hypothetical protein